MTQDDIIRMALEARLAFDSEEYPEIWQTYMNVGREEIERFAQLVAAHEREECAQLCEIYADVDSGPDGIELDYHAKLIRARGNK